MSRLITLPDGRQVTGCKNYVCTPKPALTIDTRVEITLALDKDALQKGTPLSLYLQGITANTSTPLRVWVKGWTRPVVEVTPTQFQTGIQLDAKKASKGDGPLVLNVTAGSYTLQRVALMLSDEMAESKIISQFDQYYP